MSCTGVTQQNRTDPSPLPCLLPSIPLAVHGSEVRAHDLAALPALGQHGLARLRAGKLQRKARLLPRRQSKINPNHHPPSPPPTPTQHLPSDVLGGLTVGIMLVPQGASRLSDCCWWSRLNPSSHTHDRTRDPPPTPRTPQAWRTPRCRRCPRSTASTPPPSPATCTRSSAPRASSRWGPSPWCVLCIMCRLPPHQPSHRPTESNRT